MNFAPKIRTGFFIIADISGYTSFLTETELEHAQEIIEEIIRLLLDHIQPPLKIVQLEGDAVFYYVPEEMLPEPERLLEHIEACYCDFVSHIHYARRLTHCGCRACSSMQTLDLKFFVHHGEYMIQNVPGTSEGVAGRDIILLHRLLKNSVTEKTGLRGYALLTNASLDRIGRPLSITPHAETFEHIGEVQCGLYDLQAYENRMRDMKRVYLEPRDADYIYERISACFAGTALEFYHRSGKEKAISNDQRIKACPKQLRSHGCGCRISLRSRRFYACNANAGLASFSLYDEYNGSILS